MSTYASSGVPTSAEFLIVRGPPYLRACFVSEGHGFFDAHVWGGAVLLANVTLRMNRQHIATRTRNALAGGRTKSSTWALEGVDFILFLRRWACQFIFLVHQGSTIHFTEMITRARKSCEGSIMEWGYGSSNWACQNCHTPTDLVLLSLPSSLDGPGQCQEDLLQLVLVLFSSLPDL